MGTCATTCRTVAPAGGPKYEPSPNWRQLFPEGPFEARAQVTMDGAHPKTGCPASRTWEIVVTGDGNGRLNAEVYDVSLPGQRRNLGAGLGRDGKLSTVIGHQGYFTEQGLHLRGTNDRNFDIWAPGRVIPLEITRTGAPVQNPEVAPTSGCNKYVGGTPRPSKAGRRPAV